MFRRSFCIAGIRVQIVSDEELEITDESLPFLCDASEPAETTVYLRAAEALPKPPADGVWDSGRCFDGDTVFLCNGETFKGTLTDKRSQGEVDTWKVMWENPPEGNDNYKFNYSAIVCNTDYKKASPYVFLLFYFDGEKDSIEVTFSMKNID